jgi:2-methylcitrate dehydratase PrpD
VLLAGDCDAASAGPAGPVEAVAPAVAAAAHAADRDDVHWDAVTHPGSVVWPVVLGLGAETGATGPRLAAAAAAGYEACARMAVFLGPGHRRWFHSTSTAGTVAAATAATLLLRPDQETLENALGHAISVMGGSAQCLDEHSGTQVFHRSHAVRAGIGAARAAASGLSATRLGFEGPHGVLAGPDTAERLPAALLDDGPPAIGTTSVRLCATAGWSQAAVQAAAAQPPSARACARALTVRVHRAAVDASSGPAAPAGKRWWSLEWSVATALITGDPQVRSDAPVSDETLREHLATTMLVVGDQPSPLAASVVARPLDGSPSTTTVTWPSGHPANPASDEQLVSKWSRMQPEGEWAAAARLEKVCADVLESAGPASTRLACLLAEEAPR